MPPKYTSAAQVRAAHPGAYDDLSDAQIEAGLAKQAGPAPSQEPLGERYMPGAGDDYTSAAEGELLRTGKEAAIGLARSPIDLAKGIYNMVAHPLDTLMGIGHTVAHPVEAVQNLAKNPRDAGSLLGQMLLGPKVPGAANAALAEGPSIVGRGMSAVGRAAEAAGNSGVLAKAQRLAPMELLTGHPVAAAVSAAGPEVLKGGGKLMQRGGAALDGLDLSLKRATPAARAVEFDSQTLPPARRGTEIPYAENGPLDNQPMVKDVPPGTGPTRDIRTSPAFSELQDTIRHNGSPDIRGSSALQGLKDAVSKATSDNPWGDDASAQPVSDVESTVEDAQRNHRVFRGVEPNAFTGNPALAGLENAAAPKLSPIEEFYKNDPQARGVGGDVAEGRTTGQFKEGRGGLSDVMAGRMTRNPMPETPAMSPEEASRLFNEHFGLGQPTAAAPESPLNVVTYENGKSTVYNKGRYLGSFDTAPEAHAFVASYGGQ